MGRLVDADLLVGASDIAARFGFAGPTGVHYHHQRDVNFPEPVARIGQGPKPTLVWYLPDIESYAARRGWSRSVGSRGSSGGGRLVDADLLVGASDIAARFGFAGPTGVHYHHQRDVNFPEPVARIGQGPKPTLVWYLPDIVTYARDNW